jgi:DNA-directed RNA polymerase specialized sigma24 family protein
MSPEELELSSDLEWMLLSGQVEEATLVSRLVNEEFANLYRLALSILEDPDTARAAAREAISQAVLNAHRYDGQVGVQTWLYSLTREACQTRLAAHEDPGHAITEFSPGDLQQVAAEIQAGIEKRRQGLKRWKVIQQIVLVAVASALVIFAAMTIDVHTPTPQPPTARPRNVVVTRMVYVQPAQAPTATGTPFPERAILYEAEPGDTLEKISGRVGVDAEILSSLNAIPPDQELDPGQKVMIGIGAPPLAMITPTPVTPAPSLEPLTTESSYQEILQRVDESKSNWHTLWADAVEIDYGPNGFIGPPQIKRNQVWISQPWYSLLLIGDSNERVSQAWRRVSDKVYSGDLETGKRTLSNSGTLGFAEVVNGMLYPDRYIFGPVDRSRFPPEGEMENLGAEQIAGRQSLAFDWYYDNPYDQSSQPYHLGRFWVDTSTGVITRWQQFIQGHPELLLKDIVILDIAFDVDFSNALFDQHQSFPTKFALDYRGTPEPPGATFSIPPELVLTGRTPLPKISPPPGFDPSQSPLTFEWSDTSALDSDRSTQADLFAGDYYLGRIEFVHPDNSVLCDRSPDGAWLAYSEWLAGSQGTTPLRWFNLSNLEEMYQAFSRLDIYDLAFSPDGRRLAVVACEIEVTRDCRLYLFDTRTTEAAKILDLTVGEGLAWKPDGEQIAFLGILKDSGVTQQEVVVVAVRSGEVVYRGQMDWTTNSPPADAPTHDWGVEFPARRQGLEKCEAAP